jgi:uncharacterized membrane protein YfhO
LDAITEKLEQVDKKRLTYLAKLSSVLIVFSILVWLFVFFEKELVLSFGKGALEEKYYDFIESEHLLRYDISYYAEKIPTAYLHIQNSILLFIALLLSITTALVLRINNRIGIKQFRILVLLIVLADLWFFGLKYITVEYPEKVFAERIPVEILGGSSRFRIVDFTNSLPPYIAVRHQIELITGNGAGQLKTYRDFIVFFFGVPTDGVEPYIPLDNGKIFNNSKIAGLLNVRYVLSNEIVDDKNFSLKFNLTTPVYIVYSPTQDTKNVYIYENMEFIPRAFVVHDAKVIEDKDILDEMSNKSFNPKDIVILEKDIGKTLKNSGEFEEANITYYSPDEIDVNVNLSSPGFLVLSENWYPGWKAYDNDKEKEIYKADYILRSVYLEEGSHKIKFVYDPFSFKVGLLVTVFSISSLFALVIFRFKNIFKELKRLLRGQKDELEPQNKISH